jgi:glutamyl-tRNA synthetase
MRRALALAMWDLDGSQTFDKATVEAVLTGVAERLNRKFRDLARVFYVALTGSPTSVPLYDALVLLGRDIVRERLRSALNTLGAPTASEQKIWRAAPVAVVS